MHWVLEKTRMIHASMQNLDKKILPLQTVHTCYLPLSNWPSLACMWFRPNLRAHTNTPTGFSNMVTLHSELWGIKMWTKALQILWNYLLHALFWACRKPSLCVILVSKFYYPQTFKHKKGADNFINFIILSM